MKWCASGWLRHWGLMGALLCLAGLLRPSETRAQAAVSPTASPPVRQGTLRTDTLFAWALGVRKALTVYLPPSYGRDTTRRYPVLLYLHGLGGNERNWTVAGQLHGTMDSLIAAGAPEAIVAMPDGDDSWYTTAAALPDITACPADTARAEPAASYCVPWPHYDDYITFDVLDHLDRRYRTRPDAAHRGIAGLSMGGYGAITIALAHPELFAAAASHSGVLSPRLLPSPQGAPATSRYATQAAAFRVAAGRLWPSQRLAFGLDSIAWWARDPATLASRLARRVQQGRATWPALLIDVGVDDPWVEHNRDFDATLTRLGAPHRYREWPGAHTWSYWRSHSVESLRFLLERVEVP